VERQYGIGSGPTWVFRVGKATEALAELGANLPLDVLLREVQETVTERLESRA
jgi:hypothetical protein